jgi:phosphoglucosamine mutase
MGKLFGTDGIRGLANTHPMTAAMALSVGRAIAAFFKGDTKDPAVVIGQDTRLSGDMLASALAAGLCAEGIDALLCGVIPTPAVAHHTAEAAGAVAGVVISASHNPYHDNGIKVFGPDGFKLSDVMESALEEGIFAPEAKEGTRRTGRVRPFPRALEAYVAFLTQTVPKDLNLKGLTIVLDCANGATFEAAPRVFEGLGAGVTVLSAAPDGRNINDGCGSEHPGKLAETVRKAGADLGLAFDGDGDRLIAVDETGAILTGDQVLAICARYLLQRDLLKNRQVVTTVMSNLGFKAAMKEMGITHLTTQVGDRYVMEKMRAAGANLGGEDSGHIIFMDHHTTGDGILAALQLVTVMAHEKRPLSQLKGVMRVFPQVLINVTVARKPELETVPDIQRVMEQVSAELGETGRVLVRYSGTQPMCRVMVEGPTPELTRRHCETIAEQVKKSIGA